MKFWLENISKDWIIRFICVSIEAMSLLCISVGNVVEKFFRSFSRAPFILVQYENYESHWFYDLLILMMRNAYLSMHSGILVGPLQTCEPIALNIFLAPLEVITATKLPTSPVGFIFNWNVVKIVIAMSRESLWEDTHCYNASCDWEDIKKCIQFMCTYALISSVGVFSGTPIDIQFHRCMSPVYNFLFLAALPSIV